MLLLLLRIILFVSNSILMLTMIKYVALSMNRFEFVHELRSLSVSEVAMDAEAIVGK